MNPTIFVLLENGLVVSVDIFGKSGLISVDYALKDYSNTKFTPKNEFKNTNSDLSNVLTTAAELRIGAEYRIKQWSLSRRFERTKSI